MSETLYSKWNTMQLISFIAICLLILIGLAYLLAELILELKEQSKRRPKDTSDTHNYKISK